MSKRQILMLLGIWSAVFLFLGFPSSWDKAFAVIFGILTVLIAYRLDSSSKTIITSTDQPSNVPYVEHRNPPVEQSPKNISRDVPIIETIISSNS